MANVLDSLVPDRALLMLAPMEGITNRHFRKLSLDTRGPDIVATEFVRITQIRQTIAPFTRDDRAPLQIQIMGKDADTLAGCVSTLTSNGLLSENDWLDLNVGCPSKRVNAHGAGAALLTEPKRLLEIITLLREQHRGPLSVKTRLGYQSGEDFPLLLDVLCDAPIDFITIHARPRCADYSVPISLNALQQAVNVLPFPVVGNGDVWTPEDAMRMLETGVRGVMCGRGAIQNPFLFRDIKKLLVGDTSVADRDERREELHKFTWALRVLLEEHEKKPNRGLGMFKEISVWLSRNPLMPAGFFSGLKRLQHWQDVSQYLLDAFARQPCHYRAARAPQLTDNNLSVQ